MADLEGTHDAPEAEDGGFGSTCIIYVIHTHPVSPARCFLDRTMDPFSSSSSPPLPPPDPKVIMSQAIRPGHPEPDPVTKYTTGCKPDLKELGVEILRRDSD